MNEYLDSSVIVKWFREKEQYHKNAEVLLYQMINFESSFISSEYAILEIIRALVKSNYSRKDIESVFYTLKTFDDVGGLKWCTTPKLPEA